jgi:hypothetical protein
LRANPRGKNGLLGFDPRGADVLIRNASGEDVLFGAVPAADSNNDAGNIVCYIPDDSGTGGLRQAARAHG